MFFYVTINFFLFKLLENVSKHSQISNESFTDAFGTKQQPDLKNVLRKVQIDDKTILIPANGAVDIKLRMGLHKGGSFEDIKRFIMSNY